MDTIRSRKAGPTAAPLGKTPGEALAALEALSGWPRSGDWLLAPEAAGNAVDWGRGLSLPPEAAAVCGGAASLGWVRDPLLPCPEGDASRWKEDWLFHDRSLAGSCLDPSSGLPAAFWMVDEHAEQSPAAGVENGVVMFGAEAFAIRPVEPGELAEALGAGVLPWAREGACRILFRRWIGLRVGFDWPDGGCVCFEALLELPEGHPWIEARSGGLKLGGGSGGLFEEASGLLARLELERIGDAAGGAAPGTPAPRL